MPQSVRKQEGFMLLHTLEKEFRYLNRASNAFCHQDRCCRTSCIGRVETLHDGQSPSFLGAHESSSWCLLS